MLLQIINVIVPFLVSIFIIEEMDKWMHKAREVVDKDADRIWHKWEGVLKASLFLYFFFNAGFTLDLMLRISIIAAAIAYIVSDEYWNWQHRKSLIKRYGSWLLYPGNGEGTFKEDFVTWALGEGATYNQRKYFTLYLKIVALALGVVWYLSYHDVMMWFGL